MTERLADLPLEKAVEPYPQMDDNHWSTLQELLNAISSLPGVWDKVESFMIGRGIEEPRAEVEALRRIAF